MDDRFAARRRQVAEARARRGLRRTLTVLGLLAVGAGVAYLFQSPLLSVEQVDLDGVRRSDTLGVLTAFDISPGRPLISLDIDDAEAAIAIDPWVSDVSIERDWPNRVSVQVDERVPVALVAGVMVALDGTALPGEPDTELPQIDIASTPVDGRHETSEVLGALEFLEALRSDLTAGARVSVGSDGLEALVGGFRVRLGRPIEMEEKARALAVLLDTGPEPGAELTLLAPERPAILPSSTSTTSTAP